MSYLSILQEKGYIDGKKLSALEEKMLVAPEEVEAQLLAAGLAEKDIKERKNISPVFASAKAANDYLDSL